MDLDNILQSTTPEEYGPKYSDHYLTQYRDFVASAEKVSDRRKAANQYYQGINALFVAGLAISGVDSILLAFLSSAAGVVICIAWWGAINSYATLNGAKFDVIQAMEKHLPMSPFLAEEEAYNANKTKHVQLSKWEKWVPWIFIGLHLSVAAARSAGIK